MTSGALERPSAPGFRPRLNLRRLYSRAFLVGCFIAICVGVVLLGALVIEVAIDGGAVPTVAPSGAAMPEGMAWLAWAFPIAVLAPFLLPRLVDRLAHSRSSLAPRAFAALCLLCVLPAALFAHLIYVSFEGAYYVGVEGHIFDLLGEATAWQTFRIVLAGFVFPLALLLAAWRAARRLRSPSLVWPAIILAAWAVYLFIEPNFLASPPSYAPERIGIFPALVGTLYMMAITAAVAFPLGVGAAIYLEEYARRNWFSRFIQVNIANLAGVPSIVYGLLGLQLFVRALEFERSVLAGALTMALLVMPIIIVSAQESLRAVPPSMREAAYAVGATRWQVVRYHVLPYAFGGMLTGNILAMSRAIGETAPLIAMGALTFIAFLPDAPTDDFTVLPIQIFNWVTRPQSAFHEVAASTIIILLLILLLMNSAAIIMRHRTRTEW